MNFLTSFHFLQNFFSLFKTRSAFGNPKLMRTFDRKELRTVCSALLICERVNQH